MVRWPAFVVCVKLVIKKGKALKEGMMEVGGNFQFAFESASGRAGRMLTTKATD